MKKWFQKNLNFFKWLVICVLSILFFIYFQKIIPILSWKLEIKVITTLIVALFFYFLFFKIKVIGDYANVLIAIIAIVSFLVTWQSIKDQDNTIQRQLNLFQEQIRLNSLEIRPFLHSILNNSSSTSYFEVINEGRIPATVIYYNINLSSTDNSIEIKNNNIYFYSTSTTVTSYAGKSFQIFPITSGYFPEKFIPAFNNNEIGFKIAFCIIYKPLIEEDQRYWEINELWDIFHDRSSLLSSTEKIQDKNKQTCNAENILEIKR